MNEKITGYLLLLLGLGIMIFCVVNIVMVFTDKAEPFPVFNIKSGSSTNTPDLNNLVAQLQKNNPNASQLQLPKIDILPPESLNQMLNLSTQFFLMTFILGFGYKLASLGIQLIRPINVKLKSNALEAVNDSRQPEIQVPSSSQQSSPPQQV